MIKKLCIILLSVCTVAPLSAQQYSSSDDASFAPKKGQAWSSAVHSVVSADVQQQYGRLSAAQILGWEECLGTEHRNRKRKRTPVGRIRLLLHSLLREI